MKKVLPAAWSKPAARISRILFKLAVQLIATGFMGFLIDALRLSNSAALLYTNLVADRDAYMLLRLTYLFFGVAVVWSWCRFSYWVWTGRHISVNW